VKIKKPEIMRQNKKVKFFSSFEEMENDQLEYFASLQPEELLKDHKALSLAAFGLKEDPGPDKLDRIIKFGKDE
jgi:hypothetical protein